MIRNLLLVALAMSFALFTACSSKSNNPEVDFIINQVDSMTLEEAVTYVYELNQEYQLVRSFLSFISEDDFKSYAKDEEKYTKLPEFKSADVLFNNYKVYLSGLFIEQQYTLPKTNIKLNLNIDNNVDVPSVPQVQIKAIYYYDGTVDNSTTYEPISKNQSIELNTNKVVDSVLVDVDYAFYTKYDKYAIEAGSLDIPDGKIEVIEIKNNQIKLRLKNAATNYAEIVALNAEGKPLSLKSTSNCSENAEEYAKAFSKLADKSADFKSINDVKEAMRSILGKLPSNNDINVWRGIYEGNVKSLYIYIPDKNSKVSEKKELMLKNSKASKSDFILTFDTNVKKFGFANREGKFVIPPTYETVDALNKIYYAISDSDSTIANVYYLDTLNKTLVKLPLFDYYYSVSPYNIAVKSDKNHKYALWGVGGKQLTDYVYDRLFEVKGTEKLIAVLKRIISKGDYFTDLYGYINTLGEVVLPVKYNYVGNFEYGKALVKQNGVSISFVNELGKVVIPLQQYSNVHEFSDGLAAVCKNDLYGYIDLNGRLVIPIKYKDADEFTNGIALVKNENNELGLINKDDKIVVPFREVNLRVTSGSGNSRTYILGDRKYDAWGKEIPNNNSNDDTNN